MPKTDIIKNEIVSLLIDKFDTMEWEPVKGLLDTITYKTLLNDFTVYLTEFIHDDGVYNKISMYKRCRMVSEEIFDSGLVKDDSLKVLYNKCHSKYYEKPNTDDALMELWNQLRSKTD